MTQSEIISLVRQEIIDSLRILNESKETYVGCNDDGSCYKTSHTITLMMGDTEINTVYLD